MGIAISNMALMGAVAAGGGLSIASAAEADNSETSRKFSIINAVLQIVMFFLALFIMIFLL